MFLVKASKNGGKVQKFVEVEEFRVDLNSPISASVHMSYTRSADPKCKFINRVCVVDVNNWNTVQVYKSDGERVISVHCGKDTNGVFTIGKGVDNFRSEV